MAQRPRGGGVESQPIVVQMIPLDGDEDAVRIAPPRAASPQAIDTPPAVVEPVRPTRGERSANAGALALAEVGSPAPAVEGASAEPSVTRGAPAQLLADYQRRLNELIGRNSRYPAAALGQRPAGITVLAFSLARDGSVLDSWIERSSGSEPLDTAALEALERARPLPPIPAGLPDPIDFAIVIDSSAVAKTASR